MASTNEIATEMLTMFGSAFTKDQDSNLAKYLTGIAEEVSEAHLQFQKVYDSHRLDRATGVHLDNIARLYGVLRERNETDFDVVSRMGSVLAIRRSCGTVEEIRNYVASNLGASLNHVAIHERVTGSGIASIANFRISVNGTPTRPFSLATITTGLNGIRAAGVEYLDADFTIRLSPVLWESHATKMSLFPIGYGNTTNTIGSFQYGLTTYGLSTYGDPCQTDATPRGTLTELRAMSGYGITPYGWDYGSKLNYYEA